MNRIALFALAGLLTACGSSAGKTDSATLSKRIEADSSLQIVKDKALEIVKSGFNAGDGYSEVWIRDYNTFITVATKVHPHELIKEQLLTFFRLQGKMVILQTVLSQKQVLKVSLQIITRIPMRLLRNSQLIRIR